MKILITGAGGFIGSHLTELCVERGYDVRAFVHYNNNSQWGWLDESKVSPKIEVVAGDIRDFDSVKKSAKGCDAILHLAALIGIPYSYESPLAYIRTNVEGTYNVLQAARESEACEVVVTSTSETYGTAQYVPINEQHPAVGQSPYAATKIAADQLALSFSRSFDMPVKVARPFNTYGPRQSARAIIPSVITQIAAGNGQIQLGNLSPTRDLTFVEDTARGILAILECDELNGEASNVGTSTEISMEALVKTIATKMKASIEIVQDTARVRPQASEVERLVCDNTKILSATDWRPQVSLEQGLERTIDWVLQNAGLYKTGRYTT
jgi:NAD dependent epimerase/dehydratase